MRAANASRVDVDEASLWISGDHAVRRAVDRIIAERLEEAEINLDWVLYELKDNHHLARQQGNLTASNKALDQLAKHKSIDAYAASKVDANVSGELGLSVTVKKYSNDGKVIEGAIVDEQGPKGINDERGAGGTQAGADAPVSFL